MQKSWKGKVCIREMNWIGWNATATTIKYERIWYNMYVCVFVNVYVCVVVVVFYFFLFFLVNVYRKEFCLRCNKRLSSPLFAHHFMRSFFCSNKRKCKLKCKLCLNSLFFRYRPIFGLVGGARSLSCTLYLLFSFSVPIHLTSYRYLTLCVLLVSCLEFSFKMICLSKLWIRNN